MARSRVNFDLLDDNRDGVLTRVEVFGTEPPPDLFASVDVNRTERLRGTSGIGPGPASIAWIVIVTDGCPARNSPDRWWEQRE